MILFEIWLLGMIIGLLLCFLFVCVLMTIEHYSENYIPFVRMVMGAFAPFWSSISIIFCLWSIGCILVSF